MNRLALDAIISQYEIKEASGAGEVSWDNGVHCEIPEVVISGKAEQVQYTGKNLFDLERRTERTFANSDWSNTNARDFDENSFYRGLTGNGYYKPSAISNLSISQPNNVLSFDTTNAGYGIGISLRVTPGQVYVAQSEGTAQVTFGVYDESGVYLTWSGNAEMSTITIPDGGFWMTVIVRGAVGSISAKNIQVELGSTATSYEPYTGGIPAPNPWYPIEPVFSVNTKFLARGKNLIRSDNLQYGYEIHGGGVGGDIFPHLDKASCISWYIPVKPNTTYTIGYNNKDLWCSRLCETDLQGICTRNWAWYAWGDVGSPTAITTKPNTSHISLTFVLRDTSLEMTQSFIDEAKLWIYEGNVGNYGYIPYFDGGEAVAPELLAIPGTEYRDTWDAQTGKGVRNIHKVAFTGDERWYDNWMPSMVVDLAPGFHTRGNGKVLCNYSQKVFGGNALGSTLAISGVPSDFGIETLDDWKAYLADCYAARDPVTVWYALKEPIEFQTDPQPLVQPKGACNIIQTEGTMPNCPISAKYVTHK